MRDINHAAPAEKTQPCTLALALGYIVVWTVLWYASSALSLATGISLWYPPAGLTFAILLEYGGRALPLPIVASLGAGLSLWTWEQWPYYLAINLLPPLGYAVATHVLRHCSLGRRRQEQWRFNDARQVAAFLAAAAAGSLFAALVGTQIVNYIVKSTSHEYRRQ